MALDVSEKYQSHIHGPLEHQEPAQSLWLVGAESYTLSKRIPTASCPHSVNTFLVSSCQNLRVNFNGSAERRCDSCTWFGSWSHPNFSSSIDRTAYHFPNSQKLHFTSNSFKRTHSIGHSTFLPYRRNEDCLIMALYYNVL